jgi:hypothetical protein
MFPLVIIAVITAILFMSQAIVHFNIGKSSQEQRVYRVTPYLSIHIPDGREAVFIIGTVIVFSFLSATISSIIIHHSGYRLFGVKLN